MRDPFLPPDFASGEQKAEILRVYAVVWSALWIVCAFLVAAMFAEPAFAERGWQYLLIVVPLALLTLTINRIGKPRLASILFLAVLIAVVTVLSPAAGGIRAPAVGLYPIFAIMAGILISVTAGILTAAVCAVLGIGLVVAEHYGFLPPQTLHYGPLVFWLANCLIVGLSVVLLRLAVGQIARSYEEAKSELSARRIAEKRLERALEAGQIGIWQGDLRASHFYADDRTFALLDLPVSADRRIAYETWLGMLPPDDRTKMSSIMDDLVAGLPHARAEYRLMLPNGTVRYVEATASPVKDEHGRLLRHVGTVIDISERRKAEQEREQAQNDLQENQSLLRSMIENTPAAVAMFDTEMRYIACSRRWLSDYRLTGRDLRGLSHYEVFPEIGEDWKAIHRRCLAGATESREADRFPRADGSEDVVRWVVEPWRKSNGDIGGITMFTEVITSRIREEEERRALENQLRQSQKMQALGTLAGGIAHDFNNLLAIIGSNAELGRSELPAGHPARGFLDQIVKASKRAGDIVKQILLFGRRQEAERKAIPLQPVVEDALRFLRATLPANIQIRTAFAPDLSPVLADASQIYQVIMNLGTNAAHAVSGSNSVVSVSMDSVVLDDPAVSVSADIEPGLYVRIGVQDNGVGMSRETLERVFEPFFTTKGPEGTGLGLSVVHGIVREHRGAITVESELGRGTTFRVYLPAVKPSTAQPRPEKAASESGKGQHVMYIDDEEDLAFVMEQILQRLGYRCSAYSDVDMALQAFRNDPEAFDAVITDVTMPTMTGLDVAHAMWAIRPNLPVAFTSGNWDESMEADPKIGSAMRIKKPATVEELSRALQGLLRQAH